jgi:hypothetical protein
MAVADPLLRKQNASRRAALAVGFTAGLCVATSAKAEWHLLDVVGAQGRYEKATIPAQRTSGGFRLGLGFYELEGGLSKLQAASVAWERGAGPFVGARSSDYAALQVELSTLSTLRWLVFPSLWNTRVRLAALHGAEAHDWGWRVGLAYPGDQWSVLLGSLYVGAQGAFGSRRLSALAGVEVHLWTLKDTVAALGISRR